MKKYYVSIYSSKCNKCGEVGPKIAAQDGDQNTEGTSHPFPTTGNQTAYTCQCGGNYFVSDEIEHHQFTCKA